MADRTVFFRGYTVFASVPQNLYYRINVIFGAGGANPAAGTTVTFANILSLYNAAKAALSAKGQSPAYGLGNFQNTLLSGYHGLGIVEKTVGQLENTCPSYFSSNRSSAFDSNFAGFGNSGNCGFFSGNFSGFGNSGNCGFFSGNFSGFGNGGNCAQYGGNFSSFGNSGNNAGYGFAFNYQVFHFRTGQKATVHSGNNKANHSGFGNGGNCGFFSGNFSGFGNGGNCAQHGGNFGSFGNGGNCAQHGSNFGSFGNSGNRSALYSGNFSAVNFNCYVVHSTFRVEGVDF